MSQGSCDKRNIRFHWDKDELNKFKIIICLSNDICVAFQ